MGNNIFYDNYDNNIVNTFSGIALEKVPESDPKLLAAVSSSLSDTIKSVRMGDPLSLNLFVKIRLKTGAVIERRLYASTISGRPLPTQSSRIPLIRAP